MDQLQTLEPLWLSRSPFPDLKKLPKFRGPLSRRNVGVHLHIHQCFCLHMDEFPEVPKTCQPLPKQPYPQFLLQGQTQWQNQPRSFPNVVRGLLFPWLPSKQIVSSHDAYVETHTTWLGDTRHISYFWVHGSLNDLEEVLQPIHHHQSPLYPLLHLLPRPRVAQAQVQRMQKAAPGGLARCHLIPILWPSRSIPEARARPPSWEVTANRNGNGIRGESCALNAEQTGIPLLGFQAMVVWWVPNESWIRN